MKPQKLENEARNIRKIEIMQKEVTQTFSSYPTACLLLYRTNIQKTFPQLESKVAEVVNELKSCST